MTLQCPKGHPFREISRSRVRETVEDVIYVTQTIKKFNREGSENMETVRIPEFVERVVEVDIVVYACDECNETETVREPVAGTVRV
jgi:uncharacterized UBP type Zn finger protein